jgi:hypothetical protein
MSSGETARAGTALALAEEAHALVQVSPRRALALAERALAVAFADGDVPAKLAALHTLGWAQRVVGDTRAIGTLRTGIRIGERHRDWRSVGLLRRQLAVTLGLAGQTKGARREIEAAVALLSGRDRAQSEVHRLAVHRRAPSSDPNAYRQVRTDAARALRVLRNAGDEIWEARLLYNRGLLLGDRGEFHQAEADLRLAHTLHTRLGAEAAAVDAGVALAWLALLQGDVLECLRTFAEVEAALPRGHPDHYARGLEECRADALGQVRLLPEARAAAEAYVELCLRIGVGDDVAKAMLDLASIAMMSGDTAAARHFATTAARSYAARGKPVNAALARASCLRARLLEGSLRPSSVRSGLDAAALLERAGWRRDALRTRLLVARIALARGSPATARRQIDLAQPLRRSGTVADRIELSHTRALLCLADRDVGGAEQLLAAGLGLLDDYRAALGAVELRATASGIGSELSQQGLMVAIVSGSPTKILAWAERLRGNALRLPPVRPPVDPVLRALQTSLRQTAAQIRDAEERGKRVPGIGARQTALETAIRSRTRLLKGEGGARSGVPHPRDAARTLGERVLVEYVALDGVLGAITMANGRLAFHQLGSDTSGAELEWLGFALGRLARGRNDPARRAVASGSAQAATVALQRLLVEPLLPTIGDAPLVLVPTGTLHALPWGALPSLRGRPVVVAPSLSVWLDLARLPHSRRGKTTVIAGPRLSHSFAEVRDVASLLRRPIVLQGNAATVEAALVALDGTALAHIACHGHFRSDSPLFSSLELADGPLNVYELQSLRRAPEIVVLSACDLAVSGVHPGDELLGFAAALLGMGTRTIVASVVPVADAAARRLMLAFHRNLVAGDAPAKALARAQTRVSVAGFVCLGSG